MNKLNTTLAVAAGIAVLGGISAQAQPVSGALVSYQVANFSGTTWTDSSGNGDNATWSGSGLPTVSTGVTPNGSSALDFTGITHSGFELATPLSAASGFTVFAYFQLASTTGDGGGDGRNALTGSALGGGFGTLEYDVYQGKQGALVEETTGLGSGSATLSTSAFSLIDVAVTSGAGNLNYRLNGAADGSASAGAAFTHTLGTIGNNAGGGEPLDGLLSEIDIYSGVLTPTQIAQQEAYLTSEYVTTVPEPSSWVMLAGGLGTLVAVRRFRRS
jgi:hypothetical protein